MTTIHFSSVYPLPETKYTGIGIMKYISILEDELCWAKWIRFKLKNFISLQSKIKFMPTLESLAGCLSLGNIGILSVVVVAYSACLAYTPSYKKILKE